MSTNEANPQERQRIRVNFEGIHPHAWEHPADRVGMKALKSVPGMESVLKMFLNMVAKKNTFKLFSLAAAVRVNEKQYSHIHDLYQEACKVLDIENAPELYVCQNPVFNAGAIGITEPLINLNSSLIDAMTDDEIMCILGRELGHIKGGHMLYHTLLAFLNKLLDNAHKLPFSAITFASISGVYYALLEWSRKSKLSSDRAGLLVVQDPEVAIQLEMKMTGGRNIERMDLGEFMKQAEEYHETHACD